MIGNISIESIIKYTILAAVFISLFLLLSKIDFSPRKFKQRHLINSLRKNRADEQNTIEHVKLSKRQRYFSINYLKDQYIELNVNSSMFLIDFVKGSILGFGAMFLYFKPFIFLLPIGIIGGFVAVNVKLNKLKKEASLKQEDEVRIFVSTMSTAIISHQNLKTALNDVMPNLAEPVKSDVMDAYLKFASGQGSVKEAFSNMVEKYDIMDFTQFIERLDNVVTTGNFQTDKLHKVSRRMQKRRTFRQRLMFGYFDVKKAWKAFAFFPLSIPIILLVLLYDYFVIVHDSVVMSAAFAIVFVTMHFTWNKLEELESYDWSKDYKSEH